MSTASVESVSEASAPEVPKSERFNWLEYKNGDDFPYYRGWPTTITGVQWAIVMVAVVVAFLIVGWGGDHLKGDWLPFITRGLFVAIPLGALAFVTPKHWTAIFRKVHFKDVMWMFGFGILNILVTLGVGAITVSAVRDRGEPGCHCSRRQGCGGAVRVLRRHRHPVVWRRAHNHPALPGDHVSVHQDVQDGPQRQRSVGLGHHGGDLRAAPPAHLRLERDSVPPGESASLAWFSRSPT